MSTTVSPLCTGIFDGEKFHLANCMSTLTIFCKVKPTLMLKHATTLQPYLSTQCTVSSLLELVYISYMCVLLESRGCDGYSLCCFHSGVGGSID